MLDEKLALVVLQVARLGVRHARHLLEALLDVALADEAVEGEVRRVALEARAGLLLLRHAPGLLLVEEHVDVPAPVAVVERERVAGEDALQPGLPVELLLGQPAVARAEPAAPVLRVVGCEVRR